MSDDHGLISKTSPVTYTRTHKYYAENLMLIGAGYDESWLDAFHAVAVQTGKTLMHLPLFKGIQYGTGFGDEDYYLSDVFRASPPELLIVPAGEESLKSLLVDPRVHNLMQRTAAHGGKVAFGVGADLLLTTIPEVLRINPNQMLLQRNRPTKEFALQVFTS